MESETTFLQNQHFSESTFTEVTNLARVDTKLAAKEENKAIVVLVSAS